MVGRFGWSGGGGGKRESCQILSFWLGGKTKGRKEEALSGCSHLLKHEKLEKNTSI